MQAKLHSISRLSYFQCFLAHCCYRVCRNVVGFACGCTAPHPRYYPAMLVNLSTPSSVDGHTGVFPVLVTVNAAMSIHIQVFL